MTRVVCVGEIMVDVLARLPGELAIGSDTPAPIRVHGGGAAANSAAWVAASGTEATFVGRVGDDVFGRFAVDDLRAAGVTVEVSVDPQRPTGTCIVLVDPSGERTMIPEAGANAGLPADAVAPRILPADGYLFVSGYTLLEPGLLPAGLAAIAGARERGCRIAVDAASAAPLARIGPARFLAWVGGNVLLLANHEEAHVLTDVPDAAEAARELGRRCGEAVVKSGPGGCWWSDGDEVVPMPAERVDVVDTTGAGDAFAAGFLSARLGGADVRECLQVGTATAARAVTQLGARPAPTAGSRAGGRPA